MLSLLQLSLSLQVVIHSPIMLVMLSIRQAVKILSIPEQVLHTGMIVMLIPITMVHMHPVQHILSLHVLVMMIHSVRFLTSIITPQQVKTLIRILVHSHAVLLLTVAPTTMISHMRTAVQLLLTVTTSSSLLMVALSRSSLFAR